jgi:hypothetical protein
MEKEIWKDIPEYEGLYQVSNLGRVKSFIIGKEKVLKPNLTNGYIQYCLSKNKVQKRIYCHQLIAITFLNHKPCGMKLVIDHINDNKLDNRVENLQIVTQRFNLIKSKKNKNNCTGYYLQKRRYKDKIYYGYLAQISINGKKKHIGLFKTEYEANLAYQEALKNII